MMQQDMFPAPAGMSPKQYQVPALLSDVPRTRGDEPETVPSARPTL